MLVDDHSVLREGLASILQQQSGFEVVAQAGSVDGAVEAARATRPDLVLMDYGITGGTGVDATRAILAELPETFVVFLSVHDSDEELFSAIRSGASGYLLKSISIDDLVGSLRGLMQGEAPISREMTGRLVRAFSQTTDNNSQNKFPIGQLTPRELEILRHLCSGATNKEIAEIMYLSVNTVKNHVHNLLEKLGLENRRAAAKYAYEHKLVNPSDYYPWAN